MKKINDFGEKIGGAKKDIWAMFKSLPDEEQRKYAKKDKIWKRPNYQKLLDKGIDKKVLFWQNEMRKTVVAAPQYGADAYVDFVKAISGDVMNCKTMEDVKSFYSKGGVITKYITIDENRSWKYASTKCRPYFNGRTVLLLGEEKWFNNAYETSDFLKSEYEKIRSKYKTLAASEKTLKVTKMSDGRFRNEISTPAYKISFYEKEEDFSEKIPFAEDGIVRVVMFEDKTKRRKLGAFLTEEEAEAAITDDIESNSGAGKKKANKKSSFLPPHLETIERTGSNYKTFRFTDGAILIDRYGLRGGEFGNYEAAKDRLGSLNMCFDAFEDLSRACGISYKDVSLGNKLAIAFGARGRGNAAAHYEPLLNVINITRYRGAGSLAHEWGHALDYYLGTLYGVPGAASDNKDDARVPDETSNLVEAFKYQNGVRTDFYTNSRYFDKNFASEKDGYWSSNKEMFARAFACYVRDKLTEMNIKSDYLVGHSECATDNGKFAIPMEKEREFINQKFDELFEVLKSKKVFAESKKAESGKDKNITDISDLFVFTGNGGQLKFV